MPNIERVLTLDPEDAIHRCHFGDAGLKSGEWPIIGSLPNWDRNKWALHRFLRGNPLTNDAVVVEYDPDNPAVRTLTTRATNEDRSSLPKDGTAGHIYVEQVLAELFGLPLDRIVRSEPQINVEQEPDNHHTAMNRKTAMALFFDIDAAADIKADFAKAMRRFRNPIAAAALEANADAAADPDDGPVIRIALAILLLDRRVKDHDLITTAKTEAKSATFRSHWIGADQDAEQQKIETALSILLDA